MEHVVKHVVNIHVIVIHDNMHVMDDNKTQLRKRTEFIRTNNKFHHSGTKDIKSC